MTHDPNLAEHGPQTSIKTMMAFLNGAKLDMFYGDRLLVVYAFVHAKGLSLSHLREVLDIAVKAPLQT